MGILTPALQDESNRVSEILLAFFNGLPLPVRTRDLRTTADEPLRVALDNLGELVVERAL